MVSRERRTATRVACHFTARCRMPGSVWRVVPIKDVSLTGARLVCDEPPKPGQPMDLLVTLPFFSQPVQFTAQVVWQRPAYAGRFQLSECGLSFQPVGLALRAAIRDGVQRLVAFQQHQQQRA